MAGHHRFDLAQSVHVVQCETPDPNVDVSQSGLYTNPFSTTAPERPLDATTRHLRQLGIFHPLRMADTSLETACVALGSVIPEGVYAQCIVGYRCGQRTYRRCVGMSLRLMLRAHIALLAEITKIKFRYAVGFESYHCRHLATVKWRFRSFHAPLGNPNCAFVGYALVENLPDPQFEDTGAAPPTVPDSLPETLAMIKVEVFDRAGSVTIPRTLAAGGCSARFAPILCD